MAGPNPAACLEMLARLMLLRFLYLCYFSFPELFEAYPHSPLHMTLAKLGFPEGLINYPCSGLGEVPSWDLGTTIIVVAFRFADGFSTHLAELIDLATNPSHPRTPTKALSLLLSLGRLLFPIWMKMSDIVFAYGVIRILVRLLSPHLRIVQSLSESSWLDYSLYFVSSPFIILVASWIFLAMIQTLWRDILWPVLITVSMHATLGHLVPWWLETYRGYSTDMMDIQVSSPYITHHTADILGWPVHYINIRYHLVNVAHIRLQDYPEWAYSSYSLFSNVDWLLHSLS